MDDSPERPVPSAPPRPLRADVRAALLVHGLRPRDDTPTELLRTQVRDLYLVEIRRLRDEVRRGAFPMTGYAAHVVELRRRYPLLSLPLAHWRAPGAQEPLR